MASLMYQGEVYFSGTASLMYQGGVYFGGAASLMCQGAVYFGGTASLMCQGGVYLFFVNILQHVLDALQSCSQCSASRL